MKHGKWHKRQVEQSLPAWRDKFLRYKELKPIVSAVSGLPPSPAEFAAILHAEIEKINAFFIEQEEFFIIRHKELREAIKRALARKAAVPEAAHEAEVAAIRREIVNFHGEMVLLLNYSSVNYIGLAKILKKYDKRTGGVLRLPVIANVLQQPFFTTELISKLVKDCEAMMEAVFPLPPQQLVERKALAVAEQSIFRNTVAALLTMQEVRSGSSTYGHFSMPPMTPLPDSDWLLQSFQPPSPLIPTL